MKATGRARALQGEKLLTKSEIERQYGVSRRTITRLIDSGQLTPVRVGSADRIAETEWLQHLATAHAQPSPSSYAPRGGRSAST